MFSKPYPSLPQVQVYAAQARRLRAAAVAGLFSDLGHWISNNFRIGWISAAAR